MVLSRYPLLTKITLERTKGLENCNMTIAVEYTLNQIQSIQSSVLHRQNSACCNLCKSSIETYFNGAWFYILCFFLYFVASKMGSTKRTISSPSGVTPKSKKSLFCTPQKITTPKRPSVTQCGPKMVDASTETVTTRKPFDVKVQCNKFLINNIYFK